MGGFERFEICWDVLTNDLENCKRLYSHVFFVYMKHKKNYVFL